MSPGPFAAFQRRHKKDLSVQELAQEARIKKQREREKACFEALEKVLEAHKCEIRPTLLTTPHGILPDVQIYALTDEEIAKRDEQSTDKPHGPAPAAGTPPAPTEAPESAASPADAPATGGPSNPSK